MDSHSLWHEADGIVTRLKAAAEAVDASCTERHDSMLPALARAHEEIIALARKFAASQSAAS